MKKKGPFGMAHFLNWAPKAPFRFIKSQLLAVVTETSLLVVKSLQDSVNRIS